MRCVCATIAAVVCLCGPLRAKDNPAVLAQKTTLARMDVKQLCKAMMNYQKDVGVLPMGSSPQIVDALTNGGNPKKLVFFAARSDRLKGGAFLDPWGRPFRIGADPGGDPWAYSFGPNGIDQGGTSGSDDIASWQE